MSVSISSNYMPSEADYKAAVAEFDALWNSGGRGGEQSRMEELIAVIDAYEQCRTRHARSDREAVPEE